MAEPLLTIDGQPVFLPEFRLFYEGARSGVVTVYCRKYGIQPGKGFWRRAFPEGSPLAAAEKAALTALREWHAVLTLFRQEGLLPAADWQSFLYRLAAENARRADLLAKEQPVYGPKQLTEAMFLAYERDVLWSRLLHRYPEATLQQRLDALIDAQEIHLLTSPGEAAEQF